jgi:hypothetical protein
MLAGPWESLKVNTARKLLGAGDGGIGIGGGFFDVYDISDCAHPRQLNVKTDGTEAPDNWLAHEGNWSPDGRTYWSSGLVAGSLTAIDVSSRRRSSTSAASAARTTMAWASMRMERACT